MARTPPLVTPRRPRRVLRWGLGLLLALLLLMLFAVGSTTVLLRSQAGTAWLLARVPGIEVQGLRGALLGDSLGADRMRWKGDAGAVEVDALQLGALRWTWRPSPHAWVGLHIGSLRATRVQWRSAAGDPNQASEAPSLPASLQLPAEVAVALRVQTLQIDDQAPVQDLALDLRAGADGGTTHRIDALSLRWDKLRAQGRLQLGAAPPFALDSTLQLQSVDGAPLPWTADAKASGTLERLALEVVLGSQTTAGRKAASMTLQAALTPFEPWPLADLTAYTEALDLSALSSQLPQTQLQGRALLRSKALDQPMQAELEVDNAAPGRWDEGRLPLRRLQLAIEATPTTPDRLAISRFDIRLGDAVGDAGRWSGQGQWQGSELTLDTRVAELVPQRLDSRAAPMVVGGPLSLVLQHLPSPDPAASAPARAPELTLDTRLAGQVDGAPNPVQLDLKARLSDGLLEVLSLRTRARGARAEMQASARRQDGIWSLESRGELVDFDPLPWWQGPAGSAWRSGTHRLNGDWTLALTLPQAATALPPLEMLSRLAGQGRVSIERSLLAGVPLEARIDLTQASGTRLQARLNAGGNRVSLDGHAAALGPGADDRWQVDIDAPRLNALAPIAALHRASAGWAARQGALTAALSAQGRWPSMRTEGRAHVRALRTGPLALELGSARWSAATGADAPLSVQIDLDQLAWGEQSIPSLSAMLSGSLRAHQLRASATLPLQPPPALAKSLALATGKGSRIALSADGEWSPGADGSRWAGRVQQLAAGVWDGGKGGPEVPPATDWLDGRELRAEVDLDASGALRRLHADAGQLRLANTVALRWDDIEYMPQAGRTTLQLKAEIQSFAVAPLLARWQPAMGWDGDLQVGARVDLSLGERFDADIVIERLGGDLTVRDGTDTPLALGLTDLRLALNAHDGTWLFTQGLAGRTLGELGGLVRVQANPQDLWPAASAPLDGSALLRVGNLSIWGAWVPPGWRLSGSLQASGAFSGSFGAPSVTGELRGEDLGVRNPLQGVHVTDGKVRLRLEGERATIEHFTLRGGEGLLTLTGGADLGAAPSARLQLGAERFQLLGRIDRRVIASGQAQLRLDAKALDLSGAFKVDEGLFDVSRADAPTLDADVVVHRPDDLPAPTEQTQADGAPKRAVRVALDLDLGDALVVRGRGLKTKLAGQLRVTAPGGRLAVNGTVRTVGGNYAAYGQEMTIERGLVAFSGPVESPRLDVLALRPKLDVEVGVSITGTAQLPRVRLYSNPEMSDTDKLSWLVLGKAPDALGRADTALLQRAAIALLSGEEAGPTDALIRNLGLDEFSVRHSESGDVTDTVVSLGKQISDRWYVGYERGVNATTGTWQLIYRVAQRFTLRAQSGEENALDAIWIWRFK